MIYPLYHLYGGNLIHRWPSLGSGGSSPSSSTTPSGVRRGKGKRELIVSLKDVESRESTADFLKSQLKLRHLPDSPFVEVDDGKKAAKALAAQKKREAKMRADAARAEFAAAVETQASIAAELAALASVEDERKRKLKAYNDSVIALLMIAAKEIE